MNKIEARSKAETNSVWNLWSPINLCTRIVFVGFSICAAMAEMADD